MDSRVHDDHAEKKVRKISKKDIGPPFNFNHVSHVGWDRHLEGFVLTGASNPVVDVIREAIPRLREPQPEPPGDRNSDPSPPTPQTPSCELCPAVHEASDPRCYVCWNNHKDRVLIPCGHCFCHQCTEHIEDTCFTCRAQVAQIIPLFY